MEWTDKSKRLLGTMTDSKVSSVLGCSKMDVFYARRKFGIPSFRISQAKWFSENVKTWSDENLMRPVPVNSKPALRFSVMEERKRRGLPLRASTMLRGLHGAELIRLLIKHARTLKPPVTFQALADLFGVSRQRIEQLTKRELKH